MSQYQGNISYKFSSNSEANVVSNEQITVLTIPEQLPVSKGFQRQDVHLIE